MKGFIEVESIVYDLKGNHCGFISCLINIEEISSVEERHYLLDDEDGVAITLKNKRELCTLETYEEIKQKIKEAQGE